MHWKYYFHTLRYLKLIQIRYQVWYRLRMSLRNLYRKDKFVVSVKVNVIKLSPWIDKQFSYGENAFTFLNQNLSIEEPMQWNEFRFGKLWTYNLNYMDYLLQPGITKEEGLKLISEFIRNYPNNKTGREPYTISLRGINWIKFLSKNNIQNKTINNFLYSQYLILMNNIEYHLLGNHLLENGFSLLFGSLYFEDLNMFLTANSILQKELSEQILGDGGHFERSPMYHQLILDRLLDCINLLKNNNIFNSQPALQLLMREKASSMLGWIKELSFSDKEMPLFNDSALGIAPTTKQLKQYSKSLDIPIRTVSLRESGYRRIDTASFTARIDVGDIGPDYIPGHAHADTFNFELYFHGNPLIVETGTSTYEKNERRYFERGTSAHNSVHLNGRNSSEVWGGFRVARRAHVYHLEEGDGFVKAKHDGYKSIGVTHERNFCWDDRSLKIIDRLISKNPKDAVSSLHFHPDIQPIIINESVAFEGGTLTFMGAKSISINDYKYAPEFNRLISGKVIEVEFSNELITLFNFN